MSKVSLGIPYGELIINIVTNPIAINTATREIREVLTSFFFSETSPLLYWYIALILKITVIAKEKIRIVFANCCISLSSTYRNLKVSPFYFEKRKLLEKK
ncbi:hypothetical protein [Brevibacillus laterosporus]|uniref:hypothetical protein n=1 Tax=Brevibacillus laterosporus TaxID=1465 RepID=UPI0015E2322C|nr:hypothetical protein [Brevibacillus laterosporus]